jgi:hypothetical protein
MSAQASRSRPDGPVPWFVFNRDGTPVRREGSLDAAVSWTLAHFAASTVSERIAITDNDYCVVITDERDTPNSRWQVRIIRDDRAAFMGCGL